MSKLRELLEDLAAHGAGGDPMNYIEPAREGLRELDALQHRIDILEGALEDIVSADGTSTLEGAVAIAKHALTSL